MEKLNSYLQQLLNTCGLELHLEPNKNPYILTASGRVEAAPTALPGSQINSMIFSLIPNEIKQQLPNQPEVEFVHPHNLGNFSFTVKKSPSGFNVTITPNATREPAKDEESAVSNGEQAAAQPPQNNPEAIESKPEVQDTAQSGPETAGFNDMAPEYSPEGASEAGQNEEPEEYPGSENAYQSTYDSDAIEIEVESSDSSVEADYSEFQDAQEPDAMEQPETPAPANFTSNPVEPISSVPQPATTDYASTVEVQQDPAVQDNNMNLSNPTPAIPVVSQNSFEPVEQSSFTPASSKERSEMDALFVKMAEAGASDLHLSVSMPPLIRKDGKMKELAPGSAQLNPQTIEALLSSIMPDKNREEFKELNDTDFAYEILGLARFRANVFRDRKGMGGVFRIIPSDIMTAEDLGLSKAIMKLTELSKGLVVVTGPTGSGKSTTLCAMVDSINKNREDHIITIEDPIEFTHENIKCLVNQREVNNHTKSFKGALRAALREDPDILLVGEMRDLETISIAIETAETGHLVFGTLHTTTAASTVDRIIDQFPADRQQQIRVMLSESLKGVIAQTLLPKVGGGRIAALEVLIVTPAIANLIREGKTFQIASQMQTGKNLGMQMLNDSLMDLVNKGLVEPKDAYIKAVDKDNFETLLTRNGKKL